MQVSTKLFNKQSVENFSDLTAQIQKKQEQVATGKHLTEPSDDPVKAGRVMVVKEQKAQTEHGPRHGRPWIVCDRPRACEPLAGGVLPDLSGQMGRNCAETALVTLPSQFCLDTTLGLRENPDHRDTRDRKTPGADSAQPVTATRAIDAQSKRIETILCSTQE